MSSQLSTRRRQVRSVALLSDPPTREGDVFDSGGGLSPPLSGNPQASFVLPEPRAQSLNPSRSRSRSRTPSQGHSQSQSPPHNHGQSNAPSDLMHTPRAEQQAQARAQSVRLDINDNDPDLDCLPPSSLPMASCENLMAPLGMLPLQLDATSTVEENSEAVLQSLDATLRFLTSGDANTLPPVSNAGAIADLIAKFTDLTASDPWGSVTVEGGATLYSVPTWA
ncbi:hypothetical protein NP233_g12770 [Leucocoprinus birnbaumii]|uniref:Uncharacterized protein n=1 Tax=Leucocoprinus birnbaumii TaxID=56174 RepID=A0AAD5VFU6_9AGAR|nr:hypothetical protein NP233_g12770 [Leucocoprinus birnbaumii]